jgi:pimeloyl-ACP methyl ester carboxylesterase
MEFVTSHDGTGIACERTGAGPPLVLVHGTTGTSRRWAPVLPLLEPHFTVYAMDRRGRGDSGDTAPYAMEREFEDVAAVIDSVGEPVNLLGHSFGAICALEAACRTPNIRALVLYEPPIPTPGHEVFDPAQVQRLQALLDAGDREGLLTVFFRDINGMPPAQFEQFRASPMWAARVALAHTLPRELQAVQAYRFDPQHCRAIEVPALLLLGGASPPYFGAALDLVATALPDVRTRVLAGQTHVAMDTAPQLFAGEVLAFLSA